MPGSPFWPLPLLKIFALTFDHRQTASLKRAGEDLKSFFHLRPVDGDHAQPLGAAEQLKGGLGGGDEVTLHSLVSERHASAPGWGNYRGRRL